MSGCGTLMRECGQAIVCAYIEFKVLHPILSCSRYGSHNRFIATNKNYLQTLTLCYAVFFSGLHDNGIHTTQQLVVHQLRELSLDDILHSLVYSTCLKTFSHSFHTLTIITTTTTTITIITTIITIITRQYPATQWCLMY